MKTHTVVVILEAKPEQQNQLKKALTNVIKPSRAESACLEYRLHQNINNTNQFILYQNWQSQAAHQEQFKKPYIVELATEIENLLAKPFEAYFANEIG